MQFPVIIKTFIVLLVCAYLANIYIIHVIDHVLDNYTVFVTWNMSEWVGGWVGECDTVSQAM